MKIDKKYSRDLLEKQVAESQNRQAFNKSAWREARLDGALRRYLKPAKAAKECRR